MKEVKELKEVKEAKPEKKKAFRERKTLGQHVQLLMGLAVDEDIIIKCELGEMVKRFFKDYVIVWHDPNANSDENKQYIVQLEKFCEVKTFTDWAVAANYIPNVSAACHVITSGTNGELLIKEINSSQNISSIYVFCGNKAYHETWTQNYSKVSCVETQIPSVLDQIKQNLLLWYKEASSLKINLPAFAPIFDDKDKGDMNNLHRFLKTMSNFRNRASAKADFIALSRAIYSDESNNSLITSFEENYNEYNRKGILRWYTQDSFLYKVTNNCLRIANSDSIQYCRLLLHDIKIVINQQYQEKSKKFNGLLYRGAYLSQEEWTSLKANLGREIEMHGFLSVSKKKNVALNFMRSNPSQKVFVTILVPKGPNEEHQGFAEVDEFSNFPGEQEILFNVRSRFTVLEANEECWAKLTCRHLVLLYGTQSFRSFTATKNLFGELIIPYIGSLACVTCKAYLHKMQTKMFFIPINDLKNPVYFCKNCFHDFMKMNNSPLLCLPIKENEKIKRISMKVRGCMLVYPTKTELQIPMYGYKCSSCQGKKKKFYAKCTTCYERKEVWCEDCFERKSSCIKERHVVVLESIPFSFWSEKMSENESNYINIQDEITNRHDTFQQAQMYYNSHEYQKALEYYNIYIEQNEWKANDPKLSNCYYHIGLVYAAQRNYTQALEYFLKSLDFEKTSEGTLSGEALCYEKIGTLYAKLGRRKEGLEYCFKALEIYKSILGERHHNVALSYKSIGTIYDDEGENEKALEYCLKALEILKSVYGNFKPEVAYSKNTIAAIYKKLGKDSQAFEYYSQALEVLKIIYGDHHPSVAESYYSMGEIYCNGGDKQKALECYAKSLDIEKAIYGNNHPDLIACYRNIGALSYDLQDYGKAQEYYLKALEMKQAIHDDDQPGTSQLYYNLGIVYSQQKEHNKALEYFLKALGTSRSIQGNNGLETPTIYHQIAATYGSLEDYVKAQEYYLKALEAKQATHNSDQSEIATLLDRMALNYSEQGEHNKGVECYSKALEIWKSVHGDLHHDVAASYSKIGACYSKIGDDRKALEYYLRSLEIRTELNENNNLETSSFYYNIGIVYFKQGDHNKALEYFLKALSTRKAILENNDLNAAILYHQIGATYLTLDDHKNALRYLLQSLEIKKLIYGESHAELLTLYNHIAVCYCGQEEYNRALEYYLKNLEISRIVYGENHLITGSSYEMVGHTYGLLRNFRKSAEYYAMTLENYKSAHGENHPDTIQAMERYDKLLKAAVIVENENNSC